MRKLTGDVSPFVREVGGKAVVPGKLQLEGNIEVWKKAEGLTLALGGWWKWGL